MTLKFKGRLVLKMHTYIQRIRQLKCYEIGGFQQKQYTFHVKDHGILDLKESNAKNENTQTGALIQHENLKIVKNL